MKSRYSGEIDQVRAKEQARLYSGNYFFQETTIMSFLLSCLMGFYLLWL